MHNQHKINDVLQALGEDQLSAKEIAPKLKDFKIKPRSLIYFINEYMVNRYVDSERVPVRSGASHIRKFRSITC